MSKKAANSTDPSEVKAPRVTIPVQEAEEVRAEGKSWAQVAEVINEKHGRTWPPHSIQMAVYSARKKANAPAEEMAEAAE